MSTQREKDRAAAVKAADREDERREEAAADADQAAQERAQDVTTAAAVAADQAAADAAESRGVSARSGFDSEGRALDVRDSLAPFPANNPTVPPEVAAAAAVDLVSGDPAIRRSLFQFRTGRYLGVPVEAVPTQYLREVLSGGGECHTVHVELTESEKLDIVAVLEDRAAGAPVAVELPAKATAMTPERK